MNRTSLVLEAAALSTAPQRPRWLDLFNVLMPRFFILKIDFRDKVIGNFISQKDKSCWIFKLIK